jgi:hypothetical protein
MRTLTTLSLTDIASAITREHDAAFSAARDALTHAREAGRLLLDAKAQLPHGQWLAWIDSHVPTVGARQAQKYMRLAAEWDALPKYEPGSHLPSIAAALRLLSAADDTASDEGMNPDDGGDFDSWHQTATAELHVLKRALADPTLSASEFHAIAQRADTILNDAHRRRIDALAAMGKGLNVIRELLGDDAATFAAAHPVDFAQAAQERLKELQEAPCAR